MLSKINTLYEIGKDMPIIAGFYGVAFENFSNATNYLCNINTFGLSIQDASIVWQTILKTIVFLLTVVWMFYRIKNERSKRTDV